MKTKSHQLTPEEVCPVTGKRHRPDFASAHIESDGGTHYLDINCQDCGRSGCLGTVSKLCENIDW